MKLRLRSALPGLTALMASLGVLRAADAKYQPQLAPVFTAGETFTYQAVAEFHGLLRVTDSTKKAHKEADGTSKTVRTDKILRSDQTNFSAKFSAEAALARMVFKNGSLQEAEFRVRRCELVDDKDQTVELLPAGSIIGARKQTDGQVAFAVNGQAPDANLAARLSILIPMGDEHATASDLLGAPAPMPVGASWAVNEKAMLKSDLPRIFPGVDRLAGSVVLRSAQADRTGTMRTTVTSTYQLGDVRPPFPGDEIANPSDVRYEVVVSAPVTPGPGEYDLKSSVLIHHAGHTGDIQIGMSETDMEVGFTIDQELHYVLGSAGAPTAALASAPPVPELPPLAPGMSSAPVLRPNASSFRPIAKAVTEPAAAAPAQASPQAAPSTPKPPIPVTVPPLVVPDGSPFSGAQDLPSVPPNSK